MRLMLMALITDYPSPITRHRSPVTTLGRLFATLRKKIAMNLKRTFGAVLTILGIIGLIYAAAGFVQHSGSARSLIVYGVLGVVFFFAGISLIRETRDVANTQ